MLYFEFEVNDVQLVAVVQILKVYLKKQTIQIIQSNKNPLRVLKESTHLL